MSHMLAVMMPVLLCVALGYGWGRWGPSFPTPFVTTLVTNVGAPFLILDTLAELAVPPAAFGQMAGVAVATAVVTMALAALGLRLAGLSQRTYLAGLTFGNIGNMGMPLCLFAFGEEGLGLAMAFFLVYTVGMFTGGYALAAGTVNWRRLARLPLLYAVAAGVAFEVTEVAMPAWLANTAGLLGGMTIPLMLLALGVSLASLSVRHLPRSLLLAASRLGLGLAVGLLMVWLFDLQGVAQGVTLVESTMPTAVFTYLFALRYQRAPEEVAGMILLSTLLAFAGLPILLMVVMP